MAVKKGLGRGLDSLIINTEVDIKKPLDIQKIEGLQNICIDDIRPNENQPRKSFNIDKIAELANSIKEHGVIQPIVVRNTNSGYEIVAGERRWRAARQAELKEVPCIVRTLTEEQNAIFAIIENMQREDLNPIEEAEGVQNMISNFGFTQSQVSDTLGKSRPYITNLLRLLKLSDGVKSLLANGEITQGHARSLLTIEDELKQYEVAKKIVTEGLTVRDIEKISKGQKTRKKGRPAKKKKKTADILLIEDELKQVLGTKVNITAQGSKNTIDIECYNREELERIIDLLKTL